MQYQLGYTSKQSTPEQSTPELLPIRHMGLQHNVFCDYSDNLYLGPEHYIVKALAHKDISVPIQMS